jgi:hypothetical protein
MKIKRIFKKVYFSWLFFCRPLVIGVNKNIANTIWNSCKRFVENSHTLKIKMILIDMIINHLQKNVTTSNFYCISRYWLNLVYEHNIHSSAKISQIPLWKRKTIFKNQFKNIIFGLFKDSFRPKWNSRKDTFLIYLK